MKFYFFFFLTSCITGPNFQGARVLPENQVATYGGLGPTGVAFVKKSSDPESSLIQEHLEELNSMGIFFGARMGVMKDTDFGVELSIPGRLLFDGKYKIWNDGAWALSSGLGSGIMIWDIKDTNARAYEIFLPAYVSFDISKEWGIFSGIRYIYQTFKVSDTLEKSKSWHHNDHLAMNLGTHYYFFYTEVFASWPVREDFLFWGLSIGYNLDWDKYDP